MNDYTHRDSRMLLNATQGIGPVILSRLMSFFENDPTRIMRAQDAELLKISGIGKNTIKSMREKMSSGWLAKEKKKDGKNGYTIHTHDPTP